MSPETPAVEIAASQVEQPSHLSRLFFLWTAFLLLAAFSGTLRNIAGSWFDDSANMQHGMLVPLVSAYIVWCKRGELRNIPIEPSRWGVLVTALAALIWIFSTATQWIWLIRVTFPLALCGVILTLYGYRMLRALTYPLAMLLLMIEPPTFIYERLTLQLQLLASKLGEIFLDAAGYSVLRDGNILEMVGERLAVAEACSGIRSLLALIFMVVSYNYFFVPRNWVRAALLIAVVPTAILCNAARIFATGVVSQFNHELAHGMLHETFGFVGLIIGSACVLAIHYLVKRLWPYKAAEYD